MSFATTRASLAAALSASLAGVGYKVWERRPNPVAVGNAWLVLTLADTEDITYGEAARVSYNVVFLLGSDDLEAEIELDRIGAQLIVALQNVGGRGVTVSPLTLNLDGSDLYCAVGTLITEVGSV